MLFIMADNISIARLNQLHPKLRTEAIFLYTEAVRITPVGVHPLIVQTLRTFEESDALYQKGRTRPGPKVTNAKAGQSYHNYGLAFDFCLQINGKIVWKVDKNWMKVVDLFKAHGWEWGGNFKSIVDQPHLEKTFGHNWRDLLVLHNEGKVDAQGYVII
jgi:peptidoglycan L-alanyl-D-glutamate endopeptidase CwlK